MGTVVSTAVRWVTQPSWVCGGGPGGLVPEARVVGPKGPPTREVRAWAKGRPQGTSYGGVRAWAKGRPRGASYKGRACLGKGSAPRGLLQGACVPGQRVGPEGLPTGSRGSACRRPLGADPGMEGARFDPQS